MSKTTPPFLAITIHNFPEGLAVGVAFGALHSKSKSRSLYRGGWPGHWDWLCKYPRRGCSFNPNPDGWKIPSQCLLLGIYVSHRRAHRSLLGAVAVLSMTAILPYAPFFCGRAMIFVVVEELIPDSQTNGNTDVGDPWSHGWLCHYDDPRRRFG